MSFRRRRRDFRSARPLLLAESSVTQVSESESVSSLPVTIGQRILSVHSTSHHLLQMRVLRSALHLKHQSSESTEGMDSRKSCQQNTNTIDRPTRFSSTSFIHSI